MGLGILVAIGGLSAVGRGQVPAPELPVPAEHKPDAATLAACPYCRNWGGSVNPDCPVHGTVPAGVSPQLMPQAPQGSSAPNEPPINESWLDRPVSAGVFVGVVNGSPLIDDWVGQQQGITGGLRLGYDFNEHWGTELRYAFGAIKLYDSERAMAVAPNSDVNPYETRYSDLDLVDASLVFYPWGDTRWRPYFLTGIGLTQLRFQDILGVRYSVTVPDIPLGVGLKFHVSEAAALRVELNDTIIFSGGSGFNAVQDLSLTGGLEFRFGGSRRSYWPWNPAPSNW